MSAFKVAFRPMAAAAAAAVSRHVPRRGRALLSTSPAVRSSPSRDEQGLPGAAETDKVSKSDSAYDGNADPVSSAEGVEKETGARLRTGISAANSEKDDGADKRAGTTRSEGDTPASGANYGASRARKRAGQ